VKHCAASLSHKENALLPFHKQLQNLFSFIGWSQLYNLANAILMHNFVWLIELEHLVHWVSDYDEWHLAKNVQCLEEQVGPKSTW